MACDNLAKQAEEVEALVAIYGENWITENAETRSYCVRIEENNREAMLYITLPQDYPVRARPKYELSAPWMSKKAKENLHLRLDEVNTENIGETVIFQWVEKVREIIKTTKKEVRKKDNKKATVKSSDITLSNENSPIITHGDVITDRKSSFQGHAAEVHSMEEVNAVLKKLKTNRKITNAKHNMYAYRIECKTSKGVCILQDADNDGEAHADGRMLHLLQILDQKNTLVIVTRWYGGIQLGPDRFRHINNASRQAIEKAGLLKKRQHA